MKVEGSAARALWSQMGPAARAGERRRSCGGVAGAQWGQQGTKHIRRPVIVVDLMFA